MLWTRDTMDMGTVMDFPISPVKTVAYSSSG